MEKHIKYEQELFEVDLDLKEGNISSAMRRLEKIIAEAPDFGKAYNHLGFIYETKLNLYEKAYANYKIAYEKSPHYPPLYYNFAILLSSMGKFDELNEILQKALTISGIRKDTIYYEFGMMFEMLEEYSEAIKHYKEALLKSFDNLTIDNAQAAIDRCKKKTEFLKTI